MKFNKHDLDRAVTDLAMCKFFPSDPAVHTSIELLLAKMVPDKEALTWLIAEMVNKIGEWKGPKELRGLLCTHYPPADGVEAFCSIPGYRPEDSEAKALEEHAQLKAGGTLPEALEDRKLIKLLADGKKWLR